MLRSRTVMLPIAGALALAVGSGTALAASSIKPYAVGVAGSGYATTPLWSVGEQVPETSDPSKRYQMVGIPDGLGAHPGPNGTTVVYMNHEIAAFTGSGIPITSESTIGDPLERGAFVTKVILDAEGDVISAERAYDNVFNENTLVGPAATTDNATRAFSRFCSGSLAGPEQGLDRYIYFTNEEEGTPANSFDGMGGLAVAIVDNKAYTLPKMGRFAWENMLIQPTEGDLTVAMGMEDGPNALAPEVENSQLYMYVGTKDRSATSVLRRNGLDNGELYVLVPAKGGDPDSEASFTNGKLKVAWERIPNAGNLTEAELEAASDALGAFRFARPEDGAFNLADPNQFVFVTTGGAAGANELGRAYELHLHNDPLKDGWLEVLYNADQVIAAGGDIAISPDNIDVSSEYLMIQEDGTTESRAVMATKGRDGSIWRFDISKQGVDVSTAKRVVELDPPGRDGVAVGPGIWESSGIIDASALYGPDTWLFDVQAHPPTTAPAPNTVEDGQLLLLRPTD